MRTQWDCLPEETEEVVVVVEAIASPCTLSPIAYTHIHYLHSILGNAYASRPMKA